MIENKMEYILSNYFQVYWNDIYYDDRIFWN